jgi:predicted CopG family antitoxin
MAVKTVSLKTEAYERLKSARRYPTESFSEVVLRATWPEDTITGAELLRFYRSGKRFFTDEDLDAIEEAKRVMNQPPEDKWRQG